jgi:predicted DNA-binding helix-hairpin-helix protein
MGTAIIMEPDIQQKLAILADEADHEVAAVPDTARVSEGIKHATGFIYPAARSGGGTTKLFKVLQTNACRFSCAYCFTSCALKRRRTTFKPDELATTFIGLQRRQRVEGLFLSSGIVPDADTTMEKMLATVERLRLREDYRGYVHLKLIPGASYDLIERAVELADRVSLNLEAPDAGRLALLAPEKEFVQAMWQRLRWAREIQQRRQLQGLPAARSITTQFVVGPAGESDQELLRTIARARREFGLRRAYFSAFNPLVGTPLADAPATDPAREARLYQAEFLLRDYGFNLADLPFDANGRLPLDRTPKKAWAERHLHEPVEINRAELADLLHVPGIGPRSAERILKLRRSARLRELRDLARLGVNTGWAAPYVLLDGRAPAVQLGLW